MMALRMTMRPINGQLSFTLPVDFVAEEVEVIVLPTETKSEMKKGKRIAGSWKEKMKMSADFNAALPDFQDYME